MGIKLLWVIFIEQLQFSDWNIIVGCTIMLHETFFKKYAVMYKLG